MQLVPGRECGDCTQCCIVPAIDKPEFQKEPSTVCRNCDSGCKIYETRPDTCRTFYCGWRWLNIFPNDWRPDIVGVFAQLEENVSPQFKSVVAINLVLIGNPLKTLRQPPFIDFVVKAVTNHHALFLGLPGPKGKQAARFALNTPEMMAATMRSRGDVRLELEKILKRLTAHDFIPYQMEHAGQTMPAMM